MELILSSGNEEYLTFFIKWVCICLEAIVGDHNISVSFARLDVLLEGGLDFGQVLINEAF